MNKNQTHIIIAILALVALAGLFFLTSPAQSRPPLGVTNFDSIHLRDTGGTAQPVLRADQLGTGKIVEFMDSGTPVFSILNGGSIVASSILTQAATLNNLVVSAPTAIGTATPAAFINSAGVSNLVEVQDDATPRIQAFNGGGVKVMAPTAVATTIPALYVDTAGISNGFEVRKNATPVFVVGANGIVTGQVLQNTLGQEMTCGVQTITAAATVVHGVSTPVAATCTIAADPTGSQFCTYTNATGVVTVKVWQEIASTPTANGSAVAVSWCVVGTP